MTDYMNTTSDGFWRFFWPRDLRTPGANALIMGGDE